MPRRVILGLRAQRWVDAQLDYLGERSPAAAGRLLERLNSGVRQLGDPNSGSRGQASGTRRLVVTPYILTYREIGADLLEIIDIRHGRQRPASPPEDI